MEGTSENLMRAGAENRVGSASVGSPCSSNGLYFACFPSCTRNETITARVRLDAPGRIGPAPSFAPPGTLIFTGISSFAICILILLVGDLWIKVLLAKHRKYSTLNRGHHDFSIPIKRQEGAMRVAALRLGRCLSSADAASL
jgi:hypothetical protein